MLLFKSALAGCDYSSEQYTAIFSAGGTTAQVTVTVFDDNVTEGVENFTAVLTISEFSQFLGVRLNQNGSTAIIYIEDNGESVCSPPFLVLGVYIGHLHTYVLCSMHVLY